MVAFADSLGLVRNERRLRSEETGLPQKKFTIAQIAADPDSGQEHRSTALRSIVYHNLDRVDALYRIAFGVKFVDLIDDARALFGAIKLRHDCVHRNGFDDRGIKLNVFTIEFGQKVATDIMALVWRVEAEMRAEGVASAENPFLADHTAFTAPARASHAGEQSQYIGLEEPPYEPRCRTVDPNTVSLDGKFPCGPMTETRPEPLTCAHKIECSPKISNTCGR